MAVPFAASGRIVNVFSWSHVSCTLVNIFQGCSSQWVPYHLAIATERWQDMYDEVRKTSVDL